MLHFFRKKQKYDLSWLGVDMHSHLLPGIDDGSPDAVTSVHYLERLHRLGYHTFYMTPHIFPGVHPNQPGTILQAFTTLREALPPTLAENIFLGTAAEFMITPEFTGEGPFKPNCLLPGNRILIEMSYIAASPHIDRVIYQLQINGYRPVLAHPERYPYYFRRKEEYAAFRDRGCLLQCNLLSFSGYYGKKIKRVAEELARTGMVDFIGTDLHHEKHLQVLEEFATETDTRNIFKNCTLANQNLKPQL